MKSALSCACLIVLALAACKPVVSTSKKKSAAAGNEAPVAVDFNLSVRDNAVLSVTLAATDAEGDSLVYELLDEPLHGDFTGTAPNLSYTPDAPFEGNESLSYQVSDGQGNVVEATIEIEIAHASVVYLRADGDDGTGLIGDASLAFQSAQAAVDAAIAASPSTQFPVTIDVGAGDVTNFGSVVLSANFGQHVSWRGAGAGISSIGGIDASGPAGFSPTYPGYDAPCAEGGSGEDGGVGYQLMLSGDSTVNLGSIRSVGGSGGTPYYDGCGSPYMNGNGGSGGSVEIGAGTLVGSIDVSGGQTGGGGSTYNVPVAGGGGSVSVGAGAETGTINARGGLPGVFVTANSGSGGNIAIGAGAETDDLYADAGDDEDNAWLRQGGTGGNVTIAENASVGDVSADGGYSDFFDGGTAGSVTIAAGVSHGSVRLVGGNTQWGHLAGSGGTLTTAQAIFPATVNVWGGSVGDQAASFGTVIVNADLSLSMDLPVNWEVHGAFTLSNGVSYGKIYPSGGPALFEGGDNAGTVFGDATFSDGANNNAGDVQGTAIFLAPSSPGGTYQSCDDGLGNGC